MKQRKLIQKHLNYQRKIKINFAKIKKNQTVLIKRKQINNNQYNTYLLQKNLAQINNDSKSKAKIDLIQFLQSDYDCRQIMMHYQLLMEQFYEQPQTNSRLDIKSLFQNQKQQVTNKTLSSKFIPFNQERDKLGRLITGQNHAQLQIKRNKSMSHQMIAKRLSNPEMKSNQKMINSDKTVEKIFKMNSIRGQINPNTLKLKIIKPNFSGQHISVPTIGHYNSAQIEANLKFNRSKNVQITESKEIFNRQLTKSQEKKNRVTRNFIDSSLKESQKGSNQLARKRITIDYNLPELEKYHQMRKLKMMHYDNFQQNHSRFKQLVRYSQVLAQKIKKGLQLQ